MSEVKYRLARFIKDFAYISCLGVLMSGCFRSQEISTPHAQTPVGASLTDPEKSAAVPGLLEGKPAKKEVIGTPSLKSEAIENSDWSGCCVCFLNKTTTKNISTGESSVKTTPSYCKYTMKFQNTDGSKIHFLGFKEGRFSDPVCKLSEQADSGEFIVPLEEWDVTSDGRRASGLAPAMAPDESGKLARTVAPSDFEITSDGKAMIWSWALMDESQSCRLNLN